MDELPSKPHIPQSDDDTLEFEPRPAALVARRAALIGAVLRRITLDLGLSETDDLMADRFDIGAWTAAEGLPALATEQEAEILSSPLGVLDPLTIDDASWTSEGLVALAWSLGLIDAMPPYDALADASVALAAMPAPWDSIAQFARTAKLRPDEDLARERERAEVWHWRSEAEFQSRESTRAERNEIQAAAREVAREAHQASLIGPLEDHDFAAGGRPFHQLSEDELIEMGEIAFQRLRALNWTCGFGRAWDDVPLEIE